MLSGTRAIFQPLRLAMLGTALLALGQPAAAQDALNVEVVTASEGSLNGNTTVISGAKAAVVVDVPFLRRDALRLAARLLESGKTIQTIIITHAHPDHFFGLDVLKDTFPDARVVALPEVAAAFPAQYDRSMATWQPRIGLEAPRRMVAPEAATGAIELEGQRIELIGPVQGDAADSAIVWVPSASTLIGGDVLFDQVHVYNQSTPQRQGWLATLDRIEALKPRTVVAGHAKVGASQGQSPLHFTRAYLQRFNAEAPKAGSAEALAQTMTGAYPEALDFAGGFILGTSTRAAIAERQAPAGTN